jgi:hypothetical protein
VDDTKATVFAGFAAAIDQLAAEIDQLAAVSGSDAANIGSSVEVGMGCVGNEEKRPPLRRPFYLLPPIIRIPS